MDDPLLAFLQPGLVAVLNVALAIVLGAVASSELVRRGESPWALDRLRALRPWTDAGLAVLIVVSIGLVWVLAAVMSELPLQKAFGTSDAFLTQTHAGRASAAGLAFLVLAVAVSRRRRGGRVASLLTALCIGSFAATRSWSGHSGVGGEVLPFVNDWAHVLGTGVWAGVVFAAAFVVLGASPRIREEQIDCAAYVRSLSTTATWALAAVLVTGVINAWLRLGSAPGTLFSSDWAVILAVKLALVIVAIVLGAHNRFSMLPRLTAELGSASFAATRSFKTFAAVMAVEAFVLLAVEVAAAALSTSAPPSGA